MHATWKLSATALRHGASTFATIGAGFYAGAAVMLSAAAWMAQWGSSPPAVAGLLLTTLALAGLGLAGRHRRMMRRPDARPLAQLLIAAATVAAPYLAAWTLAALRWIPERSLQSDLVVGVLSACAALVTVGPAAWAAGIVLRTNSSPEQPGASSLRSLAGMAAAFLLIPVTLLSHFDAQTVGLVIASLGCIAALYGWYRPAPAHEAGCITARPLPNSVVSFNRLLAPRLIAAAILGACVAACIQIERQLLAGVAFVEWSSLAGVIAGAASGLALARRFHPTPLGAVIVGPFWLAVLSAAFPWLVELSLQCNAYVSAVWQLAAIRSALAAALVFPVGAALGVLLSNHPLTQRPPSAGLLFGILMAAGCEFVAYRAGAYDPGTATTVLAVAALLIWAVGIWLERRTAPRRRWRTMSVAAGGLLACVLSIGLDRYDPALAARILFSTESFMEYRAGTRLDHLPYLDDGRLVALVNGPDAAWSVWTQHGAQLQLRQNGIPRHTVSLDLATCPQSAAELLPAVVPLIVHSQPRHILLNGIGSTATLSACLAFPVESVTCVEEDHALLTIARDVIAPRSQTTILDDPRLTCLHADSALLVAADGPEYDVIIETDGQAALAGAAACFTTDHYARLAARMAPDGILCQRFQHFDFGERPLRDLAATMRAVFPRVLMIESSPGEMVLLGFNAPEVPVDTEIINRASAPHVRRLLSQAGWDWSVLFALPVVDVDAVEPAVIDAATVANTARSGRFAFALPMEMMRWGPKLQESQKMLTACNGRLVDWLGDSNEADDVNQRLADVNEQYRIVSDQPDVFWAYRKSIRQRLRERPRSTIVQVAHEGLKRALHPEDERRKEYLLALSEAATQEHPTSESIAAVSSFVDPYDPLVSYFTHYEAAYLLNRADRPNAAAELAHRLHTVYFGPGYDRSVRNITAALDLIVSHPDAMPDPAQRWDHINALLEIMRQRWTIRSQLGSGQPFTAADAEESLASAKVALDRLEQLYADVPLSDEAWQARRDVIERRLIRPLRSYRSNIEAAAARPAPVDPESL